MSYESLLNEAAIIDRAIKERYEQGDPLTITARGDGVKPELLIHSFNPLAYEEFGAFRNRAPRIVGTLALRGLLVAPNHTAAQVFLGAESERNGYGIRASVKNINDIAQELGRTPGFRVV